MNWVVTHNKPGQGDPQVGQRKITSFLGSIWRMYFSSPKTKGQLESHWVVLSRSEVEAEVRKPLNFSLWAAIGLNLCVPDDRLLFRAELSRVQRGEQIADNLAAGFAVCHNRFKPQSWQCRWLITWIQLFAEHYNKLDTHTLCIGFSKQLVLGTPWASPPGIRSGPIHYQAL